MRQDAWRYTGGQTRRGWRGAHKRGCTTAQKAIWETIQKIVVKLYCGLHQAADSKRGVFMFPLLFVPRIQCSPHSYVPSSLHKKNKQLQQMLEWPRCVHFLVLQVATYTKTVQRPGCADLTDFKIYSTSFSYFSLILWLPFFPWLFHKALG